MLLMLHRIVCMCRKSETERRSMNQQNKDVELVKKVQQLESEKQAVDVCMIQLGLINWLLIWLLITSSRGDSNRDIW